MLDWLFEDPYAEARAFYGPAFPAMLAWQKKLHESVQIAALLTEALIDDVAAQAPHMGRQDVARSLMRCGGGRRVSGDTQDCWSALSDGLGPTDGETR